jgi:hypothetical protein
MIKVKFKLRIRFKNSMFPKAIFLLIKQVIFHRLECIANGKTSPIS